MKVAICNVQEFDPTIGGIERVSVSVANSLIQLGVEIVFISCRKSPYSTNYELPAKQLFLPESDDFSEKNVVYFSKLIEQEHIDILLNQNAHSELYNKTCIEVKKRTGVKLVSVLHFAPDMRIKANRHILNFQLLSFKELFINSLRTICTLLPLRYVTMYDQRRLYRSLYHESDKVVLLSEGFIPVYQKESGLKETSKLCAINNMLSFPYEEKKYKKKKQIVYCSRLTFAQKRADRMLYIWRRIQDKLPDWNLVIVGDGPLKSKMIALAQQMDLKRITFKGFTNPVEFYKESSIFCMTSNHEGWGLVLTEAMQYGCVPIAFNSYESILDIIEDGKNGFLVKPFDINHYVSVLSNLAQVDISLYSQNAIKSVEKFQSKNIGEQWKTIFEKISEKKYNE